MTKDEITMQELINGLEKSIENTIEVLYSATGKQEEYSEEMDREEYLRFYWFHASAHIRDSVRVLQGIDEHIRSFINCGCYGLKKDRKDHDSNKKN